MQLALKLDQTSLSQSQVFKCRATGAKKVFEWFLLPSTSKLARQASAELKSIKWSLCCEVRTNHAVRGCKELKTIDLRILINDLVTQIDREDFNDVA